MKKAHKKWACDYKNLQRLGEEALCGSRPKILRIPKSLSCADEVSAFCWDRTFDFSAVRLFPCCHFKPQESQCLL